MTKQERKLVDRSLMHLLVDNPDAAARGLSAIYRSARTTGTQQAVFEIAKQHNLHTNPDFII